jgi:hypothetical protein
MDLRVYRAHDDRHHSAQVEHATATQESGTYRRPTPSVEPTSGPLRFCQRHPSKTQRQMHMCRCQGPLGFSGPNSGLAHPFAQGRAINQNTCTCTVHSCNSPHCIATQARALSCVCSWTSCCTCKAPSLVLSHNRTWHGQPRHLRFCEWDVETSASLHTYRKPLKTNSPRNGGADNAARKAL